MPGQFQRFTETVLPILRKRGLFRDAYAGETFRSHLGLDVPVNRYARRGA